MQARVVLLSHLDRPLTFASLELLDLDTTVLVLYPQDPFHALPDDPFRSMLTLGPMILTSDVSAAITVANVSALAVDSIKATLSFFSGADNSLLKQQQVTIQPGETATLSMSDIAFTGPVTGEVKFGSGTALTTSTLEVFNTSTGTTTMVLYP